MAGIILTTAVQNRYSEYLRKFPGVTSVGTGYKVINGKQTKDLSVIIGVAKKQPSVQLSARDVIPKRLDDIPTDIIETGIITALKLRTDKWRPAPAGVSIGHYKITAGTLGCFVIKDDEIYILSNNHVLANSNDANIGDPIYQPGPHDLGTQIDTIAALSEFVPIDFGGGGGGSWCPFLNLYVGVGNAISKLFGRKSRITGYKLAESNEVDCAIAKPLDNGLIVNDILDIGTPIGSSAVTLGMDVQKSGRTTGYNTGTVTQLNATVTVSYGSAGTATFVGQIITSKMADGGDSGSALLNMDKSVVGLLFAGSDTITIHNPIDKVLSHLGCQIYTGV